MALKTLTVMPFRSREASKRYIKFQGWTTRQAQPRMVHWPKHPWANKRGNVAAVKVGHDPGGDLFVFADGAIRHIWRHNTKEPE